MKKLSALPILLILSNPVFAGRPLATDDASTVGDKQCQIELWRERSRTERGWVLSPACGLGEFELGAEFARQKLEDDTTAKNQSAALKWAPEFLSFGPLSFGAKAWSGRAKITPTPEDEPAGWRPHEYGGLFLASWEIGAGFSAHANLGTVRDRLEHKNARLANLALSYEPHERVLLFTESQGIQRGGVTQSVGIRLWGVPKKLGVDLTASHTAGVSHTQSISVGFGWYGFLE